MPDRHAGAERRRGSDSFLVFGVESFQSGNGWIWVARNTDPANAHNIFATAVCLSA